MTETRCPSCNQLLPDTASGPVATPLRVQHVGRSLWTVEGRPGVWCGKADSDEPDAEEVCAIVNETAAGRRRGLGKWQTLYRLDSLTRRLCEALMGKEFPGDHDAE